MATILNFPARRPALPGRSTDALARKPEAQAPAAQARLIAVQVENELARLAAKQAVGMRHEHVQARTGALLQMKAAPSPFSTASHQRSPGLVQRAFEALNGAFARLVPRF